jgi:nitroreductase
MLAATAMGYESCPMDLSDFESVAELISLPEDHLIALFVAIGRGTEAPWPRGGKLPYEEVILADRFDGAP